jgi:hypothetical protein
MDKIYTIQQYRDVLLAAEQQEPVTGSKNTAGSAGTTTGLPDEETAHDDSASVEER